MATCAKCGGEVELSKALAEEMVKIDASGSAVLAHDVCPGQDARLRKFAIYIQVVREDTDEPLELAVFHVEHEADAFADALPHLAQKLEPKWAHLQKHAGIVDADIDV